MRTRKTNWNERSTYTYEHADGSKTVLRAGENGVTEEMIKKLHAADDAEVYNNGKNGRPELQDWEKPVYEKWQKEHPNEELPSRWNISLDAATASDEDGGFGDKSHLLLKAIRNSDDEHIFDNHDVRDFMQDTCTKKDFRIYWRFFVLGFTETEIARMEKCSRQNICIKVKALVTKILRNFYEII